MGNTKKIVKVNKIDICKTEYQTSHINCVDGNSFRLKSLIETKEDKDGSYEIISFKTRMFKGDTPYFLKKDGMKVSEDFKDPGDMLNIDVELTKGGSNDIIELKFNNKINRNLKTGDIIDFHLKKPNGDPLGNTECTEDVENPLNFVYYGDKNIKYNYCASQISCD